MIKYIFLILYILMEIYLYNLFMPTIDNIKYKYEEKFTNQSKVTKSQYCAICDFIYILVMVFWPIFVANILIQIIKKGNMHVHKGKNSGGDGEGTHQD